MKRFDCKGCDKVFYAYRHKQVKQPFCSKKCYWNSKKGVSPNGIGKKWDEKQRVLASNSRRGENNGNWRGGVYTANRSERHQEMGTAKYRLWRESVFARDDYTCQECGARCGNGKDVVLNADHIKQWAYFPELRYELSNGRTLCLKCHRSTATWGFNRLIVQHSEDWVETLKTQKLTK